MKDLIERLYREHSKFSTNIPGISQAEDFLRLTLSFLFPHFKCEVALSDQSQYALLYDKISLSLHSLIKQVSQRGSEQKTAAILSKLGDIYSVLASDAVSIFKGDPAAKSIDEVIIAYPGFLAVAVHRIAHEFYLLDIPILPRLFSEHAHRATGIDIHPGAQIGRNFCIDHGTGIVIGETTVIKDDVKIYQGVTLGALSVEKSLADKKRHPTIERNVVIYANATILGGETVIGENSVIGGNVWLTSSVPANSRVYHSAETKIKQS